MTERSALIDYRLTQARESLLEADVLMKSGMSCRSVMNRLYYAMFYTVLALLQDKELGTSKHSGAIALFDRAFVKAGVFPKDMSKRCIGPLNSGREVTISKRQRLPSKTSMKFARLQNASLIVPKICCTRDNLPRSPVPVPAFTDYRPQPTFPNCFPRVTSHQLRILSPSQRNGATRRQEKGGNAFPTTVRF